MLNAYHLLGNSGLRISPLCLGAMTFGETFGWGANEGASRQMFNLYVERGGNFIDTADLYTEGTSEEFVGKFVAERNLRDRVVIATKFSFGRQPGDPNSGGNGRKHMMSAVESSLKRLKTDYIDLYWMHAWDTFTPVEETISGLNDLVRSGKVRYIGLSDAPAWYVSQANTTAKFRSFEPIIAIQMEYNLIERSIEHEYIPMALHQGMGLCSWSPLASGLLTGKYMRGSLQGGRLGTNIVEHPSLAKMLKAPRNWEIVDHLSSCAKELGKTPAAVALNWITKRPGVASTIIGATTVEQLDANIAALDFDIPETLANRLEAVSQPETVTPYMFFKKPILDALQAETQVMKEPKWFR